MSLTTSRLWAMLPLLWGVPAVSVAQDWYLLEVNPPALAVVSGYQVRSRVPMNFPPEQAVVSADGQRVFVLCQIKAQKKDPEGDRSQIAVVDIKTSKVVKTVAVRTKATNFGPVGDSGHLFAFGPGNVPDRKQPAIPASAVLIDTKTLASRSFEIEGKASVAAWTADLSRLFILEEARLEKPQYHWTKVIQNASVSVFQPNSDKPVARIPLPSTAHLMALSSDQKWLYVVDRGHHHHWGIKHLGLSRLGTDKHNKALHRDGAVHVINVTGNAMSASHSLGTSPWQIYPDAKLGTVAVLGYAADGIKGRLHEFQGKELKRSLDLGECPQYLMRVEDLNGRMVVGYDELRFVSDAGDGHNYAIPLGAAKYAAPAPAAVAGLDDWLGEPLYLPSRKRLLFGLEGRPLLPPASDGISFQDPKREVVFVNLSDRKVDHVVKAGRSGVKIARVAGQFALAMAIGMATGMATSGFGAHPGIWVAPTFDSGISSMRSGRLVAGENGEHAYALSTGTNDVTVMRTSDGGVVDKIPVGGGCFRIFAAAGGKQVCAFTDEDITFIDTVSNKVSSKFHLPKGKLRGVDKTPDGNLVVAVGEEAVIFFDGATGKQLGTIEQAGCPVAAFAPQPRYTAARYHKLIEPAENNAPEGRKLEVSAVAKPKTALRDGEALIRFLRFEDTYSLQKPSVFVEGEELARIPKKSYFSARIPSGVRKLQVTRIKGSRSVLVDLSPGSERYFEVKVKFSGEELLPVDERIGAASIADLQPLEEKWIKASDKVVRR